MLILLRISIILLCTNFVLGDDALLSQNQFTVDNRPTRNGKMYFITCLVLITTLYISQTNAENETLNHVKEFYQHRSFNGDASARQFSEINSSGMVLVLLATMVGCSLFSYGLNSRLDELPSRADKLESRMTTFETNLNTAKATLASTADCTSEVSTFTLGVDAISAPTTLANLATFATTIKAVPNPDATCLTYVTTLLAGR